MDRIRSGALTRSAYAGMFVFGFVVAVTGAILPRLPLGLGQAGTLLSALAGSMLAGMLLLGPIVDRFGKKPPLVIGSALVAAALAVLAGASAYATLLAGVSLLGFGGSGINGATNALVADLHADPRRKNAALNLLGMFFGFGALTIPLSVGALVQTLGVRTVLLLPALFSVAVAAVYAVLAFPGPKHARGVALGEAFGLVRDPLLVLFAFTLFLQSGCEFVFGGLISTFLTREHAASVSTASYVLAAFWAGIMLARLAVARISLRVPGPAIVVASAIGTAGAVVLLALAPSLGAAAGAAVLVGFFTAPVYPTVLGLAGAAFEAWSGTAFGILFSAGLAGGMAMPWTVGRLAEGAGLRSALLIPACGAVTIAVLQGIGARMPHAKS